MIEATIQKIETFVISNKALLLIITAAFVVRLPSLFEPLWYGDEAIYLTIGQEINRGGLLYTDIFDHKTPGIYYLAAWALKFLGQSIWSFKFLLTIWLIPTLAAFYFLAKLLFDKKVALFSVLTLAILTSTPLLEGNIVNSEILMILPTAMAFIFGLNKRYFIAGIFFSLSLLLKFPAVFDFAAFFVFVALSVNKEHIFNTAVKLSKLAAGLAVPFGLTFIYFAAQGALSSYINTAFLFNLSYTNYGNEFIIPNGLLIIKALPLFAIVLYFFWRVFSKMGRNLGDKIGNTELLIFWLVFSYYGAVFGGRSYAHYLIQPLVPLSIIIGRSVASVDFRHLGLSITGTVVILSLLLGFRPLIIPGYYVNFFRLVFNNISTQDYQNSFDRNTSRSYSVASLVSGCTDLNGSSECKKLRSNEEDQIYLWANQPSIYFLAKRDPATRYITAFHISGNDAAKKETINDLRKNNPRYIIVDSLGSIPFSELDRFITRRYNLFAISEDYIVYELVQDSKTY